MVFQFHLEKTDKRERENSLTRSFEFAELQK